MHYIIHGVWRPYKTLSDDMNGVDIVILVITV